jgi:hypothetical protein
MTVRELGAEYIAVGRALKDMPSSGARVGDYLPSLYGRAAAGAAVLLCFLRGLLTATPTELFARGELLAMLETLSRNGGLLPSAIGDRMWAVENSDEG